MADNKVEILYDLKIQENRVARVLEKNNEIMRKADRRTREYKNAVREVVKAEAKLANIRRQKITVNKATEKSVKSLTQAQVQAKNATGATTSAALELGRVIQDAPYGIRGMANNITQLASQLGFAAKATGSWGAAIKGMIGSLTGTLGVVFAISLVTSALDYFYGANEKAEESTSSLKEEVEALANVMKYNLNVSIRDYIKLLREKENIDKKIEESNEKILDLEEDLARVQEMRAVLERNLSTAVHNRGLIQKQLNGIMAKEKEILGEINGEYESLADTLNNYNYQKKIAEAGDINTIKGLEDVISIMKEERKTVDYNSQSYRILTTNIEAYQKKLDELTKKKKPKNIKEVKEPISKLQERLDKEEEVTREHLQKLVLMQEEDQVKKAKLKVHFDIENAEREKEIALKEFEFLADKYNKELQLYLNQQVKLGKITREQADKRLQEEANKSSQMLNQLRQIYEARISYLKSVGEKEISQAVNKEALKSSKQIQEIQKYLDKKVQLHEKELQLDMSFYKKQEAMASGAKKVADTKAKIMQGYIEALKIALDGVSSFIQAESDREVATVENKNNALNEQLNNRLLNENLSAKERKKIQNDIARNDEEARKKQNEIKKKAFNTQKAFNIANAVINTYAGATRALSEYPAPASYFVAAATIASGLLQVATISRQKFQPEAASTPIRTAGGGAGGGGVGNRSFDFNLVGSSQGNQVAEAVQGQFDKPIKAYVVSKDITNAQQLDANTKSSARFGG